MKDDFLDQVYASVDNFTECIDLVFDTIDDLLCEGKFKEVDKILRKIDLSNLNSTITYSLLGITYAAKNELVEWEPFKERARIRLKELVPERADRLVDRLK